MKKQLYLLLGLLFIMLTVITVVNYKVDCQQHFCADTFVKAPSQYLLNGANVANLPNYDERLMLRELISHTKTQKEVLVFGSERLLSINQGFFPYETFFNYSISNAVLQDYLAFIQLLNTHQQLPEKLILGIEPNLLNLNEQHTDWRSLEKEYQEMLQQLNIKSISQSSNYNTTFKWIHLFSPSYFIQNISNYKDTDYYATDQIFVQDPVKCTDGSLVLGEEQRSTNRSNLDHTLQQFIQYQLPQLKQSSQPNLSYRKCFKKLLSYLQKNDVEVIFYFPPYHHKVYQQIAENAQFKAIHDTEQYYKSVAIANGIEIIGSYNPTSLQLDHLDFYNHQQVTAAATKKVFRNTENPIKSAVAVEGFRK